MLIFFGEGNVNPILILFSTEDNITCSFFGEVVESVDFGCGGERIMIVGFNLYLLVLHL